MTKIGHKNISLGGGGDKGVLDPKTKIGHKNISSVRSIFQK